MVNVNRYLFILSILLSTSAIAATYESEHFTVNYDDNVPLNIVESFANRISANRAVVLAYLAQSDNYTGTPIKERLTVYISKKRRTPYQDWNTIHIPEKRVLMAFTENENESRGMAIIHELTHVYAVSAYRKQKKNNFEDRFYDDGLAVFMQHRFGEAAEYPDFGQDLYRQVAEKSLEYGGLIPLNDAENVRHSSKTGLGRQLAYLQEGAFTQYLIENFGLDAYLKIYQGENAKSVTGKTFEQLEKDWSTLIQVFNAS